MLALVGLLAAPPGCQHNPPPLPPLPSPPLAGHHGGGLGRGRAGPVLRRQRWPAHSRQALLRGLGQVSGGGWAAGSVGWRVCVGARFSAACSRAVLASPSRLPSHSHCALSMLPRSPLPAASTPTASWTTATGGTCLWTRPSSWASARSITPPSATPRPAAPCRVSEAAEGRWGRCACCALAAQRSAGSCAAPRSLLAAALPPAHALLMPSSPLPLPSPPCSPPPVYHVTQEGWTKVRGEDVGELHYKYYPDPSVHPCNSADPLAL